MFEIWENINKISVRAMAKPESGFALRYFDGSRSALRSIGIRNTELEHQKDFFLVKGQSTLVITYKFQYCTL
jgi:hypothetical protein